MSINRGIKFGHSTFDLTKQFLNLLCINCPRYPGVVRKYECWRAAYFVALAHLNISCQGGAIACLAGCLNRLVTDHPVLPRLGLVLCAPDEFDLAPEKRTS